MGTAGQSRTRDLTEDFAHGSVTKVSSGCDRGRGCCLSRVGDGVTIRDREMIRHPLFIYYRRILVDFYTTKTARKDLILTAKLLRLISFEASSNTYIISFSQFSII